MRLFSYALFTARDTLYKAINWIPVVDEEEANHNLRGGLTRTRNIIWKKGGESRPRLITQSYGDSFYESLNLRLVAPR